MTVVAPIKWMRVLETGIPELDDRHRGLLDDCNALLGTIAAQDDWQLVAAACRKLIGDCIEHFRLEEEIMRRTRFPRLTSHLAAHREIERKLVSLSDEVQAVDGSTPAHRALISELSANLIDTMLRHDLDYCSHMQNAQGF